jgi:hypothetical protein
MKTLILTLVFVAGCSRIEPCDPGQKLVGNISCVPDVPPGTGGTPSGGTPSGGMPSGGMPSGGMPSGGEPSGEAGADANAAGNPGAE